MILLRNILGQDGILELLKDEIDLADEYWAKMVHDSNGRWKPSRIQMSFRGINSHEFLDWFLPKGPKDDPSPQKIAAHPEHWMLRGTPEGLLTCETLGDKVSRFWLKLDTEKSDFVFDEAGFPKKMTGKGYTKSGVHMLEAYHQFRDHEDGKGFDADLAVYFPEACGDDVVLTHSEHLLVEFRNWYDLAYGALRG